MSLDVDGPFLVDNGAGSVDGTAAPGGGGGKIRPPSSWWPSTGALNSPSDLLERRDAADTTEDLLRFFL